MRGNSCCLQSKYIPFPVDRIDLENKALMQVQGQIPADENVRMSDLHSYDAGRRVLAEMMKQATEDDWTDTFTLTEVKDPLKTDL